MRASFACFFLLPLLACTDAGLQPHLVDEGEAFDDKLQIDATVCTSPPVDAYFPVKILFVVDTSDSMSVTDRGGLRAQAVAEVMNRYAGSPNVQFGVIAFDARVERLTEGFTNSPDVGAITTRLSMADRLTDYQGALGAAYAMLSEDMQASSPAERARTKYVVIFFTDGIPDPQCSSTGPDPYLICEVPRMDWQSAFDPPLPPELYPALEAGGDYNQPFQIYQSVDDIVALQDFYRVGEVRLHAGFLFDPAAAMDPLAAPFRLDRMAGVALLTEVARHGGGAFLEFTSAQAINFLSIDYTSIKQRSALAQLFAVNLTSTLSAQGLLADTDGDGLADPREFELGTCVGSGTRMAGDCDEPADSDGDGYSDLIEERNRLSGFDPLDRQKPAQPCGSRRDSDGDLLRDCEEVYLGSDPRLFDTDGDRIPDPLEVTAGLDLLDPTDALGDVDRDGDRNLDEVRAHRQPLLREASTAAAEAERYLYETSDARELGDGRSCYQVTVRNIRLVTTGRGLYPDPASPRGGLGKNRVLLYFLEAPPDRPLDFGDLRVACIDALYIDGRVKSPPGGKIELDDPVFQRPTDLDLATGCLDFTAEPATQGGDAP